MLVSLVEGFLEWINQYWKECPWSSTGNCFTLFSSLFSIFFLPALHISYKGGFWFFSWDCSGLLRFLTCLGRKSLSLHSRWMIFYSHLHVCNVQYFLRATRWLSFFFLFQFVGNVHGDEPVGRELLLRLANWICDNYMKDSLVFLFSFHYMSASKVFELYFAVYLHVLFFFYIL